MRGEILARAFASTSRLPRWWASGSRGLRAASGGVVVRIIAAPWAPLLESHPSAASGQLARPARYEGIAMALLAYAGVLARAHCAHGVCRLPRVVSPGLLGSHWLYGRGAARHASLPYGAPRAGALAYGHSQRGASYAREDHRRAGERLCAVRAFARRASVHRLSPWPAKPRVSSTYVAVFPVERDCGRLHLGGAGLLYRKLRRALSRRALAETRRCS